jgi:hypothetical protein
MNRFLPALLFLSLVGQACSGSKIKPAGDGAGGTSGGGGQGGRGGGAGQITPGPVFDGAAADVQAGGPPGSPGNPTCAEDVKKAVQVPLSLMLVVDASSSMAAGSGPAGGGSKYTQVDQALRQFVTAAGSAGLSIGLQFFPLPGGGSACSTDLDCGYVIAPTEPPCQQATICAKSVDADVEPKRCGGPRNIQCPLGDTCVPLGRCLLSFDDCVTMGQPCGGRAGDTCMPLGKTCDFADEQTCDSGAYEASSVPVVELPIGARAVGRALARRSPSGGTPMRPAVEGAIVALRNHLAGHPGQRGIVVLATDGVPGSCARNTVTDVAAVLQTARTSMPGISSYVIGVSTPDEATERMALNQLATAGGTGMPFVISATERLSQRFLETLNQIRGQALPCEFTIPAPAMGTMIDFAKVNVQIKNGATSDDVLYAASAARCDATRGGWYYDLDPAMGTPTRIIACPATCAKLKAQNEASVELKFGCKTRTIE